MSARVVHTGQAVVDLVLRVAALPEPGGDTFARDAELTAGGGFNVLAAAARVGAEVVYAGGHGTGPFGDLVRTAMAAEGIAVPARPNPGRDTGFAVAFVDDSAERTFVSTLGAEGDVTIEHYRTAAPRDGDVVYLTGYSLLHPASRTALLSWLPELPAGARVVLDPSPVVGELGVEVIRAVAARTTVWSTNEREAGIVAGLLGVPFPPAAGTTERAGLLAAALRCTVVLRAGAQGAVAAAWVAERGAVGEVVHAPGLPVRAVDTNGAGDAHCGVLCAALAAGLDLPAALHRATVAAGIAVTRPGPATGPSRAELEALL